MKQTKLNTKAKTLLKVFEEGDHAKYQATTSEDEIEMFDKKLDN